MVAGSSFRSTASTCRLMARPRAPAATWRSAPRSYRGDPAVDRVGLAGDERGLVRTEIQRQRGDLLRQPHAADRLVLRERLHHRRLAAGVLLAEVAVDERRMDPGRADAVAADATLHVVHR